LRGVKLLAFNHIWPYHYCWTNLPVKDKNKPKPSPESQEPIKCGNNILKLLIMMMDLAVTHTHTYNHRKTIWTLLLEKDAGNPKID